MREDLEYRVYVVKHGDVFVDVETPWMEAGELVDLLNRNFITTMIINDTDLEDEEVWLNEATVAGKQRRSSVKEFEYRVDGMYQAGYYTAADTEWMSAEALAKVLTADLVTTRVIDPWELQRSAVVLNDVTHVNIQKRSKNAKALQS